MDQILMYLNSNSSAIQALSSILTFLATIILAIITWRYVVLTRFIATTAGDELRMKQENKAAQERRLLMLVRSFNERIASLPCDEANREQIRKAVSWDNREIETMRVLVAGIPHLSGGNVSSLCDRLKWIKEQIDLVKLSNARIGFDWGLFSWNQWQKEIQQSTMDLLTMTLDITSEAGSHITENIPTR